MISDRFLNAFKTALACAIAFLAVYYLKIPSAQWVIITILVVMGTQIHFGGALQKAYLRFLGTIAGAAIALMTLLFLKDNHHMLIVEAVIIVCAFLVGYIGAVSLVMGQAAILGGGTVTLILLAPQANFNVAFLRASEILLGIFIALVVNIFVFPIRAKHHLEKRLEENMMVLQSYYDATRENHHEKCEKFEKTMMQNFMACHKLLEDAKREPGVNLKFYMDILLHEKRLFRAVHLLEYFYVNGEAVVIHRFIVGELTALVKLIERGAL